MESKAIRRLCFCFALLPQFMCVREKHTLATSNICDNQFLSAFNLEHD
jgi:hypothetical protein